MTIRLDPVEGPSIAIPFLFLPCHTSNNQHKLRKSGEARGIRRITFDRFIPEITRIIKDFIVCVSLRVLHVGEARYHLETLIIFLGDQRELGRSLRTN